MNPVRSFLQANEAAKVMDRTPETIARLGQIVPPERPAGGKGYRAAYSFRNLIEMRIVEEMVKFGVPRKKIALYVTQLRVSMNRWLDGHDDGWMVIDGQWNWQITSNFDAIQLGWRNKKPDAFLAISIGKIKSELAEKFPE